ncbi:unnamed protein product [Peniophora sp. CBMAI 1063]|nr:unnamed protein product [Peniophora sp. CBMAI 1063]
MRAGRGFARSALDHDVDLEARHYRPMPATKQYSAPCVLHVKASQLRPTYPASTTRLAPPRELGRCNSVHVPPSD